MSCFGALAPRLVQITIQLADALGPFMKHASSPLAGSKKMMSTSSAADHAWAVHFNDGALCSRRNSSSSEVLSHNGDVSDSTHSKRTFPHDCAKSP